MGRFFDVLNTPIAVLVVLFLVVALNSFAFFYLAPDPSPEAPAAPPADRSRQQDSGAKHGQAAPQDEQNTYVDEVGEIQANSVDAFLDSHEMLLRYDALTSHDVEKMQADQAALKRSVDQAEALGAPQKYKEHKDAFRSAIDELHQAARLAHVLAADPISATQDDFDHYDHIVNEAAADLQRSNEILGKDYKTIEGVKGVSISQQAGVPAWARAL